METPPAGFKKPNEPLRFTVTDCSGQPGTVTEADDRPHGTETHGSSGDDVEPAVAISSATGPSGVQIIESDN